MENKQRVNKYYKVNKPKKKKVSPKVVKVNDKLTSEVKNLIFFDLEMNCSFHKEENHGIGETISIGAVKYNVDTEEIEKFYSLIRPTFNNIMSVKIIELTKLLQEDINEAKSFKEVFLSLEEWIKEESCIFISWGKDDLRVILGDNDRNGYKLNIVDIIRFEFVDFQSEYDLYRKSNQAISLKNALNYYDIEFEGNQHNALDDAYNLFRVYMKYKEEVDCNIPINNKVKKY